MQTYRVVLELAGGEGLVGAEFQAPDDQIATRTIVANAPTVPYNFTAGDLVLYRVDGNDLIYIRQMPVSSG